MQFRLLQERNPRMFLLVFAPGDEVIATLTSFALENRIRGGSFQAIGALERITFAYWNRSTRKYENIEVSEQVEVVALSGNIAMGEEGEARIHAHVALGYRDGSVRGGHLVKGSVFPTLELFLNDYEIALKRRRDPQTELPLLAISS